MQLYTAFHISFSACTYLTCTAADLLWLMECLDSAGKNLTDCFHPPAAAFFHLKEFVPSILAGVIVSWLLSFLPSVVYQVPKWLSLGFLPDFYAFKGDCYLLKYY